jgi:hypothetical protein
MANPQTLLTEVLFLSEVFNVCCRMQRQACTELGTKQEA